MVAGNIEIMADAPCEPLTAVTISGTSCSRSSMCSNVSLPAGYRPYLPQKARESMGLKFSSHLRFCFSVALSSRFLMGLLFKSTEVVYG